MIKKTITFKNMDGEDVTEDWYFGLNEAEVTDMEFASGGALSARLESIGKRLESVTEEDELPRATGGEIMAVFKELIMASVGKRSEDGRKHIKTQEVRDDFVQTGAYSSLFMELINNPDTAASFTAGILPTAVNAALANGKPITNVQLPEKPAWFTEGRVPTEEEIKGLQDTALLQEAFRRKSTAQ